MSKNSKNLLLEISESAFDAFKQNWDVLKDDDKHVYAYEINGEIRYTREVISDNILRSMGYEPEKCAVKYLFEADVESGAIRFATIECKQPKDASVSNAWTMPLYVVTMGNDGVVEMTYQVKRDGDYLVIVSDDGFDGRRIKEKLVGSFVESYFGFADAAISKNSIDEARRLWNAGVNTQIEEMNNLMKRKKSLLLAKVA